MGLEHLPEEVLIIILKRLDLISIYNLYNTGVSQVQNAIGTGFLKKCDLSLSTMATRNTLSTHFFIAVSTNLLELDLKGVQDLTRKALLPAMKQMENLSTLNVAYTNITINDFLQLYDVCPTIKNISIDYQFTHNKKTNFSKDLILKCQEVFGKMEVVHFVGSNHNLLNSHLPEYILQHAKLHRLTYTLAKIDEEITYYKVVECEPIILNNFNIFSPIWRETFGRRYSYQCYPTILKGVHDYEFIVINDLDFRVVQCSPAFKTFLECNFGQIVIVHSKLNDKAPENMKACLLWNKQTTTIDDTFLEQLLPIIAPLFPCKLHCEDDFEEGYDTYEDIPLTSDSIWITYEGLYGIEAWERPPRKKKKVITHYHNLDCDDLLKDRQNVELSISLFNGGCGPIGVTLSHRSEFLAKLTFLSITYGSGFSTVFFSVLFRYAKNLRTLNVEFVDFNSSSDEYLSQISKNIGLSLTLKNLRIVTRWFKFINITNKDLCQCKSLENITLWDTTFKPVKDIGQPEILIKNCRKLYYLCIDVMLSKTDRSKKIKLLNKARTSCGKTHLCIDINSDFKYRYRYDPFIDVFNLRKIKSINL